MARYETDIGASAAEPLSLTQLLALLGPAPESDAARSDAFACFVAGAEGWEEALQRLRGAFAERTSRLNDEKAE